MAVSLEKKPSKIFSENLVRIKFIQHIQTDLENFNSNELDQKIHFLNQSYIFQLIAFWQVFIEDLVNFGFNRMKAVDNKSIFLRVAEQKLNESLKKFNTPKKENIDKLFDEVLGISKISSYWNSGELTQSKAENTLKELLEIRHQIAHKGKTTKPLSYKMNFERMKTLMEMAELTEKAILGSITKC